MSESRQNNISYRPMVADDVDHVPIGCQGERSVLLARIDELGSAAILAFENAQHVAQLQFRRYDRDLRSTEGIWNPDYWGDFGDQGPELPYATLSVFCYHVGQTDDTENRDPKYQGRGIGLALLDYLLEWAEAQGFEAIIAKCTPPERPVMGFMGGQPPEAYIARGFEKVASWVDQQLAAAVLEREIVSENADLDAFARVGVCVKRLV